MIVIDVHPTPTTKATVRLYPEQRHQSGFAVLAIGHAGNDISIFGTYADVERFEKIAALLNESFKERAPSMPRSIDPAELAGDYMVEV